MSPAAARISRAFVAGLVTALAVGAVLGVAVGVFDLALGLIVLAAVGGYAIGFATRRAGWGPAAEDLAAADDQRPPRRTQLADQGVPVVAAVSGAVAWVAGVFIEYVVGLAALPASGVSLPERMAAAPFGDYLATPTGPPDVLELALLAFIAARVAARRTARPG